MKDHVDNTEMEKSKAYITVEIIGYLPQAIISKTIIKKTTGNICAMSFDDGEGWTERMSPFDAFVQIIDGSAEIVIDAISYLLETGQSIIIPAHVPNFIRPNGKFKIIMTVIKSGYE